MHPSVAGRTPQRPADAYHLVAQVLPDWYWTTPPPPDVPAVELHARGRDGIRTRWLLPADVTEVVVRLLLPAVRAGDLTCHVARVPPVDGP